MVVKYLFPIFYKFGCSHITCLLKCMSFLIFIKYSLDQHSRKDKGFGSVTLIWGRWLGDAVSMSFLFYVFQFLKVDISFVRAMCCEF